MELDVLAKAPLAVQIHVAAAVLAVGLGPVAIWRRSRDLLHRVAGRVWVAAILIAAVSSFLIHDLRMLGPFSIIHVLSLITLVGLWRGISAIRRGDVAAHQSAMRGLYLQALVLAGVFTFLPGRRMNAVFFAETPQLGFMLMAAVGTGLGWLIWREGKLIRRRSSEPARMLARDAALKGKARRSHPQS